MRKLGWVLVAVAVLIFLPQIIQSIVFLFTMFGLLSTLALEAFQANMGKIFAIGLVSAALTYLVYYCRKANH